MLKNCQCHNIMLGMSLKSIVQECCVRMKCGNMILEWYLDCNSKCGCASLCRLPNMYINDFTIYSIEKPSIYKLKNTDVVIIIPGAPGRWSHR